MQFKRQLLTASVATALLQLTACGGSSSSDTTNDQITPADPVTPVTQSLSGLTADGYLVNAKVCLDLNDNMACDDDEPSTMTTEGGQYVITDISEQVVLSEISVVVEAIAGVTIDEDEPDVAITEGYTLTAPAGKSRFISPLSTLLATEIEDNPELTEEEAQQMLEQKMGLEGSGVSLLDDYVAGKVSNETKADKYKHAHRVAQVLAKSMAKSLTELDENGETLGDASRKEMRRAIVATLASDIETVVNTIDEAVVGSEDVDMESVLNQLKEALPLSSEELQAKVQERRENRKKSRVNLATLLAGENGIYTLAGKTKKNTAPEVCATEKTPAYKNRYLQDGTLYTTRYTYVDGIFEPAESDTATRMHWVDTQWQEAAHEAIGEEQEDGSVEESTKDYGKRLVKTAEKPLEGQSLQQFAKLEAAWSGLYEKESVFSEGALAYQITKKQAKDVDIMRLGGCAEEPCNSITLPEGEAATSLTQLLNSEETAFEDLVQFTIAGNDDVKLQVILYGEADATSGELAFFKDRGRKITEEYLANSEEQGEWVLTEKGIEFSLPGWVKNHTDNLASIAILTEHDGYVRKAFTITEGTLKRHWSFNDVALEDLKNLMDPSYLTQPLPAGQCGGKPAKDKPSKEKPEVTEPEVTEPETTAPVTEELTVS